MRILEIYRKIGKHEGNTYSSILFADRNDNKFTLSYISGNIEIMVDNDSVVVEDVLEAYNNYKELEKSFHKKNSELQKNKTKVKKITEYRKHFFLKDINETLEKLNFSDKDKELLRQVKELEK